jgi:hypothetical protein
VVRGRAAWWRIEAASVPNLCQRPKDPKTGALLNSRADEFEWEDIDGRLCLGAWRTPWRRRFRRMIGDFLNALVRLRTFPIPPRSSLRPPSSIESSEHH